MERATYVRQASEELGIPVKLLADMQGAKIRLGGFEGGEAQLTKGMTFRIDLDIDQEGDSKRVGMPHPELLEQLEVGHELIFDDGNFNMHVSEVGGGFVNAVASKNYVLKSRKGITAPDVRIDGASFTSKDRKDGDFALDVIGVDIIVQSFVDNAENVDVFADFVAGRAKRMTKVETKLALEDIDNIIVASDSVMVGRGDLGVAIGKPKLPNAQRGIVSRCRAAKTYVVVATGMAEAGGSAGETTDVSQAVYQMRKENGTPPVDGAAMLSAEVAAGDDPVGAVKFMCETIVESELYCIDPERALTSLFGKAAQSWNEKNEPVSHYVFD